MTDTDEKIETFDKKDFFAWCASKGLTKPEEIKDYFRLSGQTIRNWEKDVKSGNPDDLEIAFWVRFAIALYDGTAGKDGKIVPAALENMTFSELEKWRNDHGFKTYESTANVFNIKRQAVHLWHKRHKIPAWVALACAGYGFWVQSKNK
jgi:DNA-binding transcriptional regulator YiaG